MKAAEKHVTLRDIARRVRLSIGAVSLALRDHPSIPVSTAQRVKRMAARMNYVPDPALSALAAYRRRLRVPRDFAVIALVSNWATADEWIRHPSARELMAGATERARSLGYSLQHFWVQEKGMTAPRFSQVLYERGIRGIILAPFEKPTDLLEIAWKNFAAVTIELPVRYDHLHYVVPNHFAGMRLAWEQLQARGYRRIGFMVRQDLAERGSHQWEAAHAFLQSRSPQKDRIPSLLLRAGHAAGEISQWLRRERPDVVISRSEGFFAAACRAGLRVPEDVGYASLNVVDDQPGVSGIIQHRDVMGAVAVEVLNHLLQRNQRGGHSVPQGSMVNGTWQEGWTLRLRRGLSSRGPAFNSGCDLAGVPGWDADKTPAAALELQPC